MARSSRCPVSKADAAAYLAKARGWLAAARDNVEAERFDAAAGSAVTAGINACDAISGTLLGERSSGDHDAAVALLATAGQDGKTASRQLAQLLRYKAPAQYDPIPISAADARKAVDLASRLSDRAAAVLTRSTG